MKYKQFYRRNLPHIQPEDAVLFITYRLFFKLPAEYQNKIQTMKFEFNKRVKSLDKRKIESEKYKFEKKLFDFKDNFIGKFKNSPFWLKNKNIAEIVKDSLFWGAQKRYDLFAFCIMPNHVHKIIRPLLGNKEPFPLQQIMYDHKHFTAIEANKILKRKGHFWQDEQYDHYIRNEKEFFNILNYLYMNPVKANLVEEPEDWEHTFINEELL